MKFRKWELALIAAVIAAVLFGTGVSAEQKAIADKVVRLHVIANSDSDRDQTLKLKVRDAVISELSPKLESAGDISGASAVIETELEHIRLKALETLHAEGEDMSVSVTLGEESYPTREYDTFALPAGDYMSLRIVIGEGRGKNWWCVVFPPLCTEAAIDSEISGLSDKQVMLITGEADGYEIKFRTLEIIAKLKQYLGI